VEFTVNNIVDCIAEYQDFEGVAWFIETNLRGTERYPIFLSDFDPFEGTWDNPIVIEEPLGSPENPIVFD
jgi:hypothetical protein